MKLLINTTNLSELELEKSSLYSRYAVRSITIKDNKVLTLYSNTNGDYSLPGGGIEGTETKTEALYREVKEETGYDVTDIKELYIELKEYHKSKFKSDNADYFENTSYYYLIDVSDMQGEQSLTESEIREKIEIRWQDIDAIISNNKDLMEKGVYPRWVIRETMVFEYIRDNLL